MDSFQKRPPTHVCFQTYEHIGCSRSQEVIDFSECVNITNDTLEFVVRANPKVKGLNLRDCGQVGNRGIKHLAEAPDLFTLNLEGSMIDTSRDECKTLTIPSSHLLGCFLVSKTGLDYLLPCKKLQVLDLT